MNFLTNLLLRAAFVPILLLTIVNSASAATFIVVNSNASGSGSLRQAILDANSNTGVDTITFNVNGGGPQTILTGDLPRITDPVILDASTQPGYTGTPLIELTGPGLAGVTSGLTIDAGNTTIRGFVINNFGLGGIGIFTNGGNVIEGNYIGTNAAGDQSRPNFGEGIRIFNSSNNRIGGATAASRNLISGNSGAGIALNGTTASGNVIQGNYIGTNVSGTLSDQFAMRNGREGICLCSSNGDFAVTNNLVGGTVAGTGNLISANTFDEIRIGGNATNNTVQGNLIGTNAAGTIALHRSGNGGNGIFIDGGSNNLIGGTVPGARNVISGQIFGPSSGGSGIKIERGVGNVIQGNYIGTDITGTLPIPNSEHGIQAFEGVRNTVIGGTETTGAGNIIAFNTRAGVLISTSTTTPVMTNRNSIRGNSIHSNGQLGIDLATDIGTGVTPNDHCDADQGVRIVNDLQNYPQLTHARSTGSVISINGVLDSSPGASFNIDFYASPTADSTGYGEGKTYLGSTNVITDAGCIANFGASFTINTSKQFITATATDANGNTSEFSQSILSSTGGVASFDFDGDGKTDVGIFRPNAAAEWWISKSSNNGVLAAQFGASGDQPVPADYTGDGKTDMAFFRPSTGTWFVLRSDDFSFYGFPFGSSVDVTAPADYDGDGKADPAVFRDGAWYIVRSSDGGVTSSSFGVAGDKPVPADYDGDGKADIGIFRPNGGSGGEWWILRSTAGLLAASFGSAEDKTVVGDYTGDGKADCAFFRPSTGTWYVLRSEDLSFFGFPFGGFTDNPAPGDYDGDGKTDAAVFRQPGSQWFVNKSSGGVTSLTFGSNGDLPVPGSYVR